MLFVSIVESCGGVPECKAVGVLPRCVLPVWLALFKVSLALCTLINRVKRMSQFQSVNVVEYVE